MFNTVADLASLQVRQNEIDFSKPVTHVGAIKVLLCKLINDARNTVVESKVSAAAKAEALFELFTGSQTCGFVDNVCSINTVEEMVINSPALVKSIHYKPKGDLNIDVHVFIMKLPNGYDAFTEMVCSHQVDVSVKRVPNPDKTSRIKYVAESEEPQHTNIYHFVVVSDNNTGEVVMDRWEPGAYIQKRAYSPAMECVQLGNRYEHGKRATFPLVWYELLQGNY